MIILKMDMIETTTYTLIDGRKISSDIKAEIAPRAIDQGSSDEKRERRRPYHAR